MRADRPPSECHDQAVCTPDDQGLNQAKPYECNFCKKGFSNAQALGGHMNIHRKEKARLKEAPKETQSFTAKIVKPLELPSTPDKSTSKRLWDFSSSEDYCSRSPRNRMHGGEVKQLSVLDETAPRNNKPEPNIQAPKSSEEGLPSSQAELDLELRLGHKPLESSATRRA